MSRTLKWQLLVGVLVVFLAGFATGAFATAWHVHRVFGGVGRKEVIAERMRRHLTAELGLSAEQLEKITPLIEQTAARLTAIRSETGKRVQETMEQSRRELAPNLTPQQIARLDQIRENHGRMVRHRNRLRGPVDPP